MRIVQDHSSVVVLTALSWIYKECVLHCRYQPSQSLLVPCIPTSSATYMHSSASTTFSVLLLSSTIAGSDFLHPCGVCHTRFLCLKYDPYFAVFVNHWSDLLHPVVFSSVITPTDTPTVPTTANQNQVAVTLSGLAVGTVSIVTQLKKLIAFHLNPMCFSSQIRRNKHYSKLLPMHWTCTVTEILTDVKKPPTGKVQ